MVIDQKLFILKLKPDLDPQPEKLCLTLIIRPNLAIRSTPYLDTHTIPSSHRKAANTALNASATNSIHIEGGFIGVILQNISPTSSAQRQIT